MTAFFFGTYPYPDVLDVEPEPADRPRKHACAACDTNQFTAPDVPCWCCGGPTEAKP